MKLLRYGSKGQEKPGLLDSNGHLRDLSGKICDIDPSSLNPASMEALQNIDPASLPLVKGTSRLGPCVAGSGKFMCIGLNYFDHAAEAGMEVPTEPILFMKATSSICGANDALVIPRGSKKTDWEVELGVIIGKPGKHISIEEALDFVAGYCVINDVSERAFQLEGTGQWVKGKSCDSFGPIGPWLVTGDEIADPQNLPLWLEVNGRRLQNGNTRTMVFGVAAIISYLSRFMTLYPGDIISTGTPPGVGMGLNPPNYLKAGDRVKLGIEGLGE
ncbi:MAG: fumarylacetoacetate hydrolase family protein, partial [Desulfocapsa sp.]|nr:fumarylacetoacetate hydrolase family protein [Desulfocapsa sp.]